MTLRITTVSRKNKTTIRGEGHLAVEEIENLQKEFQLAAVPVHLDLSGLRSADAEGVQAGRRRRHEILEVQEAELAQACEGDEQ